MQVEKGRKIDYLIGLVAELVGKGSMDPQGAATCMINFS